MTSFDLLSGTCIRLFAQAVYVGTYWRGCRTPETSKTYFVTVANTLQIIIVTKSARKEKEHCSIQIPTNKCS